MEARRFSPPLSSCTALFAAALALRLLPFPWFRHLKLFGDERYFWNFAADPFSPNQIRPPLWAWVLSVPRFFTDDPVAGRLVEVCLGSLIAVLVFVLAWRLFRPKTAWTAGLIVALHPNAIFWSHLLWPQALFGLLLIAAAIVYLPPAGVDGPPRFVGASAVLGIALLAKEFAIAMFAAILVLHFVRTGRRELRTAAAGALVFAGPFLLWTGIIAVQSGLRMPYGTMVGTARMAAKMGFDVRVERPVHLVAKNCANLPRVWHDMKDMWGATSYPMTRTVRGEYPVGRFAWLAAILFIIPHTLLVLVGMVGLLREPNKTFQRFALTSLAFVTAMSFPFQTICRYRVPFMFLLMIGAARFFADYRELAAVRLSPLMKRVEIGVMILLFYVMVSTIPDAVLRWWM